MPSLRHPSRALILAVAGVVALAACGDDDDAGSDDATPTSASATTASGEGPATTAISGGATTASGGSSATTAPSTEPTTPSTGGTPSGSRVELVDAGAEGDRVQLPGTPEVGQSAAAAVTMDIELEMEGPGVSEDVPFSFRIQTEAEVVEVTDSGYVEETTITNAELEEGPPGFDEAGFGQIVGITYRRQMSASGEPGDAELVNRNQVTPAQRQAFNQFIGQLQSSSIVYPPEPVGVGARWRATQSVTNQGLSFDITYDYELASVEGDSYQIDVTYDQDIDEDIQQGGQSGRMRGTVTGGGQSSGSLAKPLLVNTSMRQELDVDIAAGGQELAMTMDVRVDLESTER